MEYTPDFDLHEALLVLNPFIASQAEGSKERKAFELAQIALLYIYLTRKEKDFREFYKSTLDPSLPSIKVAHEFATREEADQWRASGNAKDYDRVKIAGKGHMVVEVNGKLYFMIAPLPEELNSPEWQDDSEDDPE
ncbi:hypothetical protein [Archangium sp.]|uniref:hypothetical protein n=1 Tax=Archangium sp. TaxID=1872627 RepID=UPI00286C5542|nr:hypothetical protein [Archangium sp.]